MQNVIHAPTRGEISLFFGNLSILYVNFPWHNLFLKGITHLEYTEDVKVVFESFNILIHLGSGPFFLKNNALRIEHLSSMLCQPHTETTSNREKTTRPYFGSLNFFVRVGKNPT